MRITFKDVGQGDSILLEWKDVAGKEKIGIIDCNMKGKLNPVLDYLKNSKYREIAFIVLSHPHLDHYSGLLQLLEYCEVNGVSISNMAHTVGFTGADDYWKYFEVGTEETNLFSRIKSKWFNLLSIGIIKSIDDLTVKVKMEFDHRLSITCLSPSHADRLEYMRRVKLDNVGNKKLASQAANLLSTLLRIEFEGFNYLLTSDVDVFTFSRIYEQEQNYFENVRFHLCQVPHHGSEKNYFPGFWDKIVNFKMQRAVASAGNEYGHPNYNVLRSFYDKGYRVHCTNKVNGMSSLVRMINKKSAILNTVSKLAIEYRNYGDQVFEIHNGKLKLIKNA